MVHDIGPGLRALVPASIPSLKTEHFDYFGNQ